MEVPRLGAPGPTVAHHRTGAKIIVSDLAFTPSRTGNHPLSWRKEERTRMGAASSTQRRRCLLRKLCTDALLLKEQCAFNQKVEREIFACHHTQTGNEVGFPANVHGSLSSGPRASASARVNRTRVSPAHSLVQKGRHQAFARPRLQSGVWLDFTDVTFHDAAVWHFPHPFRWCC